MSYLVLARKWRPRTFDQLVGQDHVRRALTNALDSGRIHHAFLFTGTRGVGKTTIARIFAKSLNCEKGVSSTPCGQCPACVDIDAGRFVDLLEVDAASRTKVDDTRELLDNVQYSPARGRYKVYLIDEVHMLSTHSFNALLKTLEEPPPHVKFLLATTDPQKLPVTVLSRCLQFHLRRLPLPLIYDRLALIATAEKVEFEPAALRAIARGAEGSMRDALSLLDQVLAFGGGRAMEAEVRTLLGTLDRKHVQGILTALAGKDGAALMQQAAHLDERAPDYHQALGELSGAIQRMALLQALPDLPPGDDEDEDKLLAGLAATSITRRMRARALKWRCSACSHSVRRGCRPQRQRVVAGQAWHDRRSPHDPPPRRHDLQPRRVRRRRSPTGMHSSPRSDCRAPSSISWPTA
jgi:DNA polymerase III subunit gamma/tau